MLIRFIMLFLCLSPFYSFADGSDKKFVVIVPSYNNLYWFQLNLKSIIKQDYSNFRVLYLDDCSKDGMGPGVDDFVRKHVADHFIAHFDDGKAESIDERTESFCRLVNENRHFFTVIHNVNRCGALENLYRSIVSTEDDEIIVTLDGDDWFYHNDVLKELNEVYSSKNVWMTHGCLKQFPSGIVAWSIPIPDDIVATNAFRSYRCPSHLRTFYSWLFKKINLEDLLFEGKFFTMTWDMAMMYPMIEMAGERHAFISNPNYVYNQANQINDNKVNAQLQRDLDVLIRAKEPYQRLD
jgi:glycosyltransferase involved in cell wall biosynthesis